MAENGLKHLICGGIGHPTMDKLMETGDPRGPIGRVPFSLWICQQCGVMAIHLETPGDIYWYKSTAVESRRLLRHRAGCAYCSTRFDCWCDSPGQRHMCDGCDAKAEESKMTGEFPGPIYPEDLQAQDTATGHTDDF